jgi:hypothetical protein
MRYYNEEQAMLLQVAASTIGRILRHEFELEQQEMPHHMRQLLAQLDSIGRSENAFSGITKSKQHIQGE